MEARASSGSFIGFINGVFQFSVVLLFKLDLLQIYLKSAHQQNRNEISG
jgi:hypothetical protein